MKKAGPMVLKIALTFLAFFIASSWGVALTEAVGAKYMGGPVAWGSFFSLVLPIWRSSRMEWRIMSALGGLAAVAGTWLFFYLAVSSYVIDKVGVGMPAPHSIASTASTIGGLSGLSIFVGPAMSFFLLSRGRKKTGQTESGEKKTCSTD